MAKDSTTPLSNKIETVGTYYYHHSAGRGECAEGCLTKFSEVLALFQRDGRRFAASLVWASSTLLPAGNSILPS